MGADEMREAAHASRSPSHDVEPLLIERWSARAMTGEPLEEEAFLPLFEAARWAPSSRNRQPWHFRYATRQGEHWETFLDLLNEGNRRWAKDASLLVAVCSRRTTDDGDPIRDASFSTGAAWQNLALEGTRRGLVVHPMLGFDREAAREALDVSEDCRLECMTAIGPAAPRESLPEDLRERETPSDRKPLSEVATSGPF